MIKLTTNRNTDKTWEVLFKGLKVNYAAKEDGTNNNLHVNELSSLFPLLRDLNFDCSQITELDLSNCDLTELPYETQSLKLKRLNLGHNKIIEVPPVLYSGLNAIEELDLSYNLMSNFDIEPACWPTLKLLNLSNNKIHNLPQWILVSMCPNLRDLIYSGNKIFNLDTKHTALKLRKVVMCNSKLIDMDFTFFKRIPTLEYLDISNDRNARDQNSFQCIDKLFISPKWSCLQVLRLSFLCLSIIPVDLFRIVTLKELHLVCCDLSWVPSDIKNLTNLEELDVSSNVISSVPVELFHLEFLRVFKAAHNYICAIPRTFKSRLQILDLYDNMFDENPLDESIMQDIQLCDFEYNYFDTNMYSAQIYHEKKNAFREKYDLINRMIGPNMAGKFPSPQSSSETSSISDYDDNDTDFNCTTVNFQSEENWDEKTPTGKVETKVANSPRNPDITVSDNEWDGADIFCQPKTKKTPKMNRNFVADEAWIFCDVENCV